MRRKVQCQIVLTTAGSRAEAERLAAGAVRARLAACVQIEAVRSHYRWKGKVERAPEWRLLAKTRSSRVPALIRWIRAHHSYELPEILAVPVSGGWPAYLRWIAEESAP